MTYTVFEVYCPIQGSTWCYRTKHQGMSGYASKEDAVFAAQMALAMEAHDRAHGGNDFGSN